MSEALAALLGVASAGPPPPPLDADAVFAAGRRLGEAEARAAAAAETAQQARAHAAEHAALADAAQAALEAHERALAEALPGLAVALAGRILEATPDLPDATVTRLAADTLAALPGAKLCAAPELADRLRTLGLQSVAVVADATLAADVVEARLGDAGARATLGARTAALGAALLATP
jgi:hypothetical protein